MKTKYLLPILFVIYAQNIFAQITFLKLFADIPDDIDFYASDLKPTSDSGYIVTGFNWQNNQTSYGPFLIKLDINGDTVWTKHYENSPGGGSVTQTCDGGYVSFGYSDLFKTNSNGDTLWAKIYPEMVSCRGYITNDCGFVLLGVTNNLGTGQYDIYVIKTDAAGIPLWSKTYGADSTESAGSFQQTADGGFIIAGSSNSFSVGVEQRIYVIKTGTNGDTLWTKTYGLSGTDIFGRWIRQTVDHGYIILGGNNNETYLIKTDSTGNVLWSKIYAGVNGGGSILQDQDSGYVFTCSTITGSNNTISISLIKTNSSGDILWHNAFVTGDIFNYATPIFQTTDGGYVFSGTGKQAQGMWQYDRIFVKKTNTNGLTCGEQFPIVTASTATIIGNSTATIVTSPSASIVSSPPSTITNMTVTAWTNCTNVGIKEVNPQSSSTISPNVTTKNGSVSISLDEDLKNAVVTVYNVMGVAIHNYTVNDKGKTILLTLKNNLSPGMYFIRIMQGDKVIVKKIVVL